MKSPLDYAARCLSDMEDRWVPYSGLWWRFWTPRIPRGDRYQEGVFTGYGPDLDDDDADLEAPLSPIDIRRLLANPVIRLIYKKLPYIDVVPVSRPWEAMTPEQRRRREEFVTESTLTAYNAGKALYSRETIAHIEAQLTAAGEALDRRMPTHKTRLPSRFRFNLRHRLLSRCEAPQTAFLSFPAFDDVTTHVSVWAPGAALTLSSPSPTSSASDLPPAAAHGDDNDGDAGSGTTVYRPGRSQIEFRTIQELTQPDPENLAEQFAPDAWMPAVGYQPITVCNRMGRTGMVEFLGEEAEQIGLEGLRERLEENVKVVRESAEWMRLMEAVRDAGARGVLAGVEKVVFFYGNGMTDDCDYCERARLLFAVAWCVRKAVMKLWARPGAGWMAPIIYMPAYDILRKWNAAEISFLRENRVAFVESNGELFLKVDERAAVVSYRNWNPVKQVVADIAKPAVLICRPVSDDPEQDFAWKTEDGEDGETVKLPTVRSRLLEPSTIVVDPDSPRVRRLVKDYDRFELPELPGVTEDKEVSCLYLRKADARTAVDYR